jgi:hypothetical protein
MHMATYDRIATICKGAMLLVSRQKLRDEVTNRSPTRVTFTNCEQLREVLQTSVFRYPDSHKHPETQKFW